MAAKDREYYPLGTSAILTLPKSKSGTGYNMIVRVKGTEVRLLHKFQRFTSNLLPGEPLVLGGQADFRRFFDEIVKELQLPRTMIFKPHSIRRGAATVDF